MNRIRYPIQRLVPAGLLGLVAGVCAVSCAGNFDTTRTPRAFESQASIGQEVFGVLCDRVGASVLQEDLDGRSFRRLCHPDSDGNYDDTINVAMLPPASDDAAEARRLAIAKMERFAAQRADFVRAVDIIVPDIEVANPYAGRTKSDGTIEPEKVALHDALLVMLERLNPLYDSNPLVSEGPYAVPLLPTTTQMTSRVVKAMMEDERVPRSLAIIGGRKGHYVAGMSMGALRSALKYPGLRSLYQNSVRLMSPGGPAWQPFRQLLNVVQTHAMTATFEPAPGPFVVNDPHGVAQPNRPRDSLELLQHVLLATDPTFKTGAPTLAVLRDTRGFALVAGNTPGLVGTVSEPFADVDADGLPDIDEVGRFVDAAGRPVQVDYPFDVAGHPRVREADALGRALLSNGQPAYQYVDTSQTLVGAFLKDLGEMANPDLSSGKETLMYAIASLPVLAGDRKDNMHHAIGRATNTRSITFRGFDAETSPLVHLAHALGQVLAHPQSDDFLQLMIELVENHPSLVARLASVLLDIKHISDEFDYLSLPQDSNLLNQLTDVLGRVVRVGISESTPDAHGLLEDVLLALANEDSVALGQLYAKFMSYRDVLTFDSDNLNGGVRNLTTNNHAPPTTPVDRTKPAVGDNRSMFFRTMQLIFDSTRTTACNKQGAKVRLKAQALGLDVNVVYPDNALFALACPTTRKETLDWCDVYRIDSLTEFYLQSVVESDPKLAAADNKGKAKFEIRDKCLASMSWATNMDQAFELSSGITGMTTRPTPSALNRLVHYGSDSVRYTMPDLDPRRNESNSLNQQVNLFLRDLQDPFGTPVCVKNAAGVDLCSSADDTLRIRDFGTLFLWEQFRFVETNRPLLYAFYKHDQETLFADLMDVVYWHMEPKDHGPTCSKSGSWDRDAPNFNPRYCAETGLVNFEPMLAKVLASDLVPTLHELMKVLEKQTIHSVRFRAAKPALVPKRRGSEVLASMIRVLLDPKEARAHNIVYRNGKASTKWRDGVTVKEQTTPFDMLLEAFDSIDERFRSAKDYQADDLAQRHKHWKTATTQIFEQFFSVEGKGNQTRFRNPAIPKALGVILRTLREQLNAHCPKREQGISCKWAKQELANEVARVITNPLFAASIDVLDELRKDARRDELQSFIQYMVSDEHDGEAIRRLVVSLADLIGMLRDRSVWPPILNAVANLARRENDFEALESAPVIMQLLRVLSHEPDPALGSEDPLGFDAYHVFNMVLANLTEPVDPSNPSSKTVIEVLMDVMLSVNRHDSADTGPMTANDYKVMIESVYMLLTDRTRGLEQLYEMIRGASGY